MKTNNILFWIVLSLAAFAVFATGCGELFYLDRYRESLTSLHFTETYTRILGLIKVTLALGLFFRRIRIISILGICAVLIGAIGAHWGAGHGLQKAIIPAIVLCITLLIPLLDRHIILRSIFTAQD